MIAIANIGKYLAVLFHRIEHIVHEFCGILQEHLNRRLKIFAKCNCFNCKNHIEESETGQIKGKTFFIIFFIYITIGSYAISLWEPELTSYSTAVYFNLLSLTSAGLGDYWPKK
jgi:hypothetical protein